MDITLSLGLSSDSSPRTQGRAAPNSAGFPTTMYVDFVRGYHMGEGIGGSTLEECFWLGTGSSALSTGADSSQQSIQ
jgi:hypothetical protein